VALVVGHRLLGLRWGLDHHLLLGLLFGNGEGPVENLLCTFFLFLFFLDLQQLLFLSQNCQIFFTPEDDAGLLFVDYRPIKEGNLGDPLVDGEGLRELQLYVSREEAVQEIEHALMVVVVPKFLFHAFTNFFEALGGFDVGLEILGVLVDEEYEYFNQRGEHGLEINFDSVKPPENTANQVSVIAFVQMKGWEQQLH
jgi:hypothetical protein